jgi:Predicted GTPase
MHNSAIANAAGADFWIVSPERTMLRSKKRVIAICAARTGSGKSQTTRYVSEFLRRKGVKAVIIRHPMPYGILKNEIVERFERKEDLDRYKTTIEEREEYEQHINNGFIVYAGVDYEKILRSAEKEADVIIWDGGNNDAPFIRPDLMVAVIDPLRPGDELAYYPGEVVVKIADIVLINKANSVTEGVIASAKKRLGEINKDAVIVVADSEIKTDNKEGIRGKRVLLIEDGPTITHGGMPFGAAMVASQMFGAKSVVEARKYVVGTIKETFEKYPLLKEELPAMGYSKGRYQTSKKQ